MANGKWQWTRLIDIFFLGPFMIYYALASREIMDPMYVYILAFFGASTILFNAYFYIKVLKVFNSYLS